MLLAASGARMEPARRLAAPDRGGIFVAWSSRRSDRTIIAPVAMFLLAAVTFSCGDRMTVGADEPAAVQVDGALRIATFDIDASPRVGSPLAYDPCDGIETPLTCRGVVLLIEPSPVVYCAVDWIGIANGAHRHFRERLAEAAGTTADRVAVHALHQHDAPWADLTAAELLAAEGIEHQVFDVPWFRDVVDRAAAAVREAIARPSTVTQIALGAGEVAQVASNRRILGPDGKVQYTRWSATKDESVREMPVGLIDPLLRSITLLDGDRPLVTTTFYATHPQSYYRTRLANSDFPGLARDGRQAETGVLHVHFDGAGGNITAGKWNDGSPENRRILADRLAAGMRLARDAERTIPITSAQVGWRSVAIALPPAEHLDESALVATLGDDSATAAVRGAAAADLAWLRRCRAGETIDVGCLTLGDARILFLPGELFVEYQLEAQAMLPERFVAVAAYGDYGPGYIGTAVAYDEGGYETSARASRVAPGVERVLREALRELLDLPAVPEEPSGER